MYNIITCCILHPKLTRNKYTILKQFLFISCIITSFTFLLPTLKNVITVYGQSEKDIEYQQSYWTESSESVSTASSSFDQLESPSNRDNNNNNNIKKIEKEVGPGEGISTLAIELVNTARSDITAVKGFLTLPSGFQAAFNNTIKQDTNGSSTKKNISLSYVSSASHNSIVEAGNFFTLFFDINILNNIDIGQYNSSLKIIYSKVLEKGKIISVIPIQFEIPGKVILDTVLKGNGSKEKYLIAGQYNEISLVIKNKGSSYANGVIATIKGFEKQTNESENLKNDASNGNNDGLGTTSLSSSAYPLISAVNTGNRTFDVGTIPPGSSVIIKPNIYIANSAKESVQNLELQLTYGDSYGNKQTFESSIGIIVSPLPSDSNFNVTPMLEHVTNTKYITKNETNNTNTNNNTTNNNNIIILTAGTIEDLTFKLQNNAKKNVSSSLTDLVVNLDVSPKESIEILGNSRWIFDSMDPQSYFDLGTKIFASEQIANTPVEFSINIDYISNQELKKESLVVGAYIEGQIKISGHDFEIRKVGDTPNFGGNLLNEGNSRALFTKVTLEELKSVSNLVSNNTNNNINNNNDFNGDNNKKNNSNNVFLSRPQEQYLGDLDSNSPLPFSIPIDLNINNTKGKYSFSLSVYYSDNLRKMHHVILNGTVDIINNLAKESQRNNNTSFEIKDIISKNYLTFTIFIAIILIVIIGILYARKKRKKSIPAGFGLGNENNNNNTTRKDDSLFYTSTGLFDDDDDEEKDAKK
jgi:hypothetical protein